VKYRWRRISKAHAAIRQATPRHVLACTTIWGVWTFTMRERLPCGTVCEWLARMTEQRRLAAIVSADVAGYSRLMGRDESGTLAALKALRKEVLDPAIASHGGRIVKTTGDGLLLEFPSVVNAVRCAVEVQTAMAVHNAGVAEDRRIAFRIGINLGDIIVEGDDIFGDGVNVAARLQEIATPGGICISSRVHEDIRDRIDACACAKVETADQV
jgi:class 3 adenylate cyclase